MTIYVVCHRDSDSANEFFTFGNENVKVETIDIDYGYADLREGGEFADWRGVQLGTAADLEKSGDPTALKVAAHIRQTVAEAMDNYGHTEQELQEIEEEGSMTMPYADRLAFLPNEYEYDSGIRLAFDTLCDREVASPEEVKRRMDNYEGDFWNNFFGPVIDQIESALFPEGTEA